MTNREVKIEIAKAALGSGLNIETAKAFYDWVIEEPERELPEDRSTQLDNTPIEELAHKTLIVGTVIKRCKDNGINTVGDLIRCGGIRFSTFKNVGRCTIQKIDDALERYYHVSEWYRL